MTAYLTKTWNVFAPKMVGLFPELVLVLLAIVMGLLMAKAVNYWLEMENRQEGKRPSCHRREVCSN